MVYLDDPESGSTHCAGGFGVRRCRTNSAAVRGVPLEPVIELDDGGDWMAEAKSSTDLDNGNVLVYGPDAMRTIFAHSDRVQENTSRIGSALGTQYSVLEPVFIITFLVLRVALGVRAHPRPAFDKVVNNESDSGAYRSMRHLGYCARCHPSASALPLARSPFVITYFADLELAQRTEPIVTLPVPSALRSLRDPSSFPSIMWNTVSFFASIHWGDAGHLARIRQDLRHPVHGDAIEESECVSRATECGVSHEQRAALDLYKFRNEVGARGCSGGREGRQETEGGLVRGGDRGRGRWRTRSWERRGRRVVRRRLALLLLLSFWDAEVDVDVGMPGYDCIADWEQPEEVRSADKGSLAAVTLVQNEGKTVVHKWTVTGSLPASLGFCQPRLDSNPPPDADSPPAADVVQHFKAAVIRLLERFSQGTCKRKSWTRIAHLVESEPHKAAALIDAVIAAVGAEHAEKFGGVHTHARVGYPPLPRPRVDTHHYPVARRPPLFLSQLRGKWLTSSVVLLSTELPSPRFQHVTNVLAKQLSIVEVSSKIAMVVGGSLSRQQKALFLRQELAGINAELQRLEPGNTDLHGTGNGVEDEDELDLLIRRVNTLPVGSEMRGYRRDSLPEADPSSECRARRHKDIFKRRLMEYLAVVRLRALIAREAETEQAKAQEVTLKKVIDDPAVGTNAADGQKENGRRALVKAGEIPTLPQVRQFYPRKACRRPRASKPPFYYDNAIGHVFSFIGPLGTRKTSLGQSIARALGRPFQRIALVGPCARPVVWIQFSYYLAAAMTAETRSIRLVSRITTVIHPRRCSRSFDPEQNVAFNGHYLNVPIDLSQILFANSLDTISPPLLVRCEVIQLSGYTHDGKLHNARRFLLPKQLTQNGLSEPHVQLTEPALLKTVTHYTREAGVRSLERSIGGITVQGCRVGRACGCAGPGAFVIASSLTVGVRSLRYRSKEGGVGYNPLVKADELEKILGLSRYEGEDREREARQGVVWGLVMTGMGEIIALRLLVVASQAHRFTWDHECLKRAHNPLRIPDVTIDVHLHLPAGAQKEDGPSAGVAMVCAVVSLLTGKCVPAITGEIKLLRGSCLPRVLTFCSWWVELVQKSGRSACVLRARLENRERAGYTGGMLGSGVGHRGGDVFAMFGSRGIRYTIASPRTASDGVEELACGSGSLNQMRHRSSQQYYTSVLTNDLIPISSTMFSSPQTSVSSSQFESIISAALNEFKEKTEKTLLDDALAKELQSCDSVEAVMVIIQGQAKAFDKFRNGGSKLMKWVHSSVHVLYTISAALGDGVGVVIPSAKAVFTGIGILLAAAKDVRASHDALVDLFERIQFFLKRLGVHTRISPTKDMVEILVKIMAEVISILSIATKEMQQSKTNIYFRKLLGRTDIEDALKKLDGLTQEEVRMAIAQVLQGINELKDGAEPHQPAPTPR
ncbi:hypothetical protein EDB89DRAFT_1902501 [Lactarius sanguifluus]|nr:hypothetical protein EDB89DRAFT_1902501 [Lactarius sanguifluus]